MQNDKAPQLIQTKYGYWTYRPSPSQEELGQYYAGKYYQQGLGSYAVSYTDEEVEYFRLKPSLLMRQLKRLRPAHAYRTFLDVGCGEGWALDRFYKEGFDVTGTDFSAFGLEKFHSHLCPHFVQGNVYETLRGWHKEGRKWDMILLANVIEHVIDPEELLQSLKELLEPDGLMILVAPNDFSALHHRLLDGKFINKAFWLAYPDHLSYFNREGMLNFLNAFSFAVEAVVADNPVDLNLLNANSNYMIDRDKGKETHYFRVRTDNFLASIDEDKLLDLYTTLGSMGVGRDLNYFCGIVS